MSLVWRNRIGFSRRVSDAPTPHGKMAHNESNFSMSACEYAAPTTRPESRLAFLGVVSCWGGLQNGEADLSFCWQLARDSEGRAFKL